MWFYDPKFLNCNPQTNSTYGFPNCLTRHLPSLKAIVSLRCYAIMFMAAFLIIMLKANIQDQVCLYMFIINRLL